MTVWVPVGAEFIEADVIRWKEPVFKNRRHGRSTRLGERLMIAEVLSEANRDGWVYLLVRGGEVVSAHVGWNPSDVPLPPKDGETRRRLSTIVKGGAERLVWSDESARSIVASQFLRNLSPAPRAPLDLGDFDDVGDPDGINSLRSSFNAAARMNQPQPPKPGGQAPGLHR
jgi:hypothetical protein